MIRKLAASFLLAVLFLPAIGDFALAQSSAGQTRVLSSIPAIAQTFAPIVGVKWQEFAQVLAGICAVESTCSPTYPHYTSSGVYSQYQGLFQFNNAQVEKAEADLQRMLPQIQSLAQSGSISSEAYQFFDKTIREGRAMTSDKRYHPEYGVVLGAVKHIQINKQLADQYPNQPIHQAAGHMTGQFAGITYEKIRRRAFNAVITPNEAWALGQNKVAGVTVAGAIESAGATYGNKMRTMIARMVQVTGDMSLIPSTIEPFNAPPFQPGGAGNYPNVSRGPVSELLESGFIKPDDARVKEVFPSASQGSNLVSPGQSSTPDQTNQNISSGARLFASTLVTQSTTAVPGQTVLLAWSSVGMQSNSCTLGIKNAAPFIQGKNEGDQRFQLPSLAASGSVLELELKCMTLTGQNVVKGASIRVE